MVTDAHRTYSSQPAVSFADLNPFEQRDWVECHIQPPQVLQEVPLLRCSERLLSLSRTDRQSCPDIIAALQQWLKAAHIDDIRLLIRRPWIPFVEVYFPQTEAGNKAYGIAQEIGALPRQCDIVPANQNQRFWLKTKHYLWQTKGVLLAQALCDLPGNLQQDNLKALRRRINQRSIKNATHIAAADLALYRALENHFDYLREQTFSPEQRECFPTPWRLFVALAKEAVETGWQLGPASTEINGPSQDQQREYLYTKSRLLEDRPWLEGQQVKKGKRNPYRVDEAAFIDFLENQGSPYGQVMLALRGRYSSPGLEEYAKLLRQHKEAYVSALKWQGGKLYKHKVTSSLWPVDAAENFGYLQWCWR
jgi:hypothetical protein